MREVAWVAVNHARCSCTPRARCAFALMVEAGPLPGGFLAGYWAAHGPVLEAAYAVGGVEALVPYVEEYERMLGS